MPTDTIAAPSKSLPNSLNDIPGPKGHWLKGCLDDLKSTPLHLFFYRQATIFGAIFKVRVLHKSMVVLSNPKTVQYLLKERPERFRRLGKLEVIFKEMGIHGVFSAEGESWKNQRKLMNPAFKPSQIKKFLTTIQQCAKQLRIDIHSHPTDNDIQNTLMAYTVNITSNLAFGIDLKTLEENDPQFQRHLNSIFPLISYRLHAPFPYWRLFKLKRDRDFDISFNYVNTAIHRFIDSAKAKLNQQLEQGQNIEPINILESMILAQIEGKSLSETELVGNVLTLLLAGEDTTANTLAWAMHYLADQANLQQALFEEVQQNYPKDHPLGIDDLERFPLIFAAAQESMRLRPVAPHLLLEPYSDEIIEGYKIPKGTMLVALLATNGFKDSLFPNAKNFDPERWLTLSEADKKQHSAELMHFGSGPRLCPGRQLSFVEMKIALIELIRHFKFSRNNSQGEVQEVLAFTAVPVNLRIDFVPRNHAD